MKIGIYIGQYYGKSLVSKLIQWKTWSDISHTSAFLPDQKTVIEAWGGGVINRPWREGHTPGTRVDLFFVECAEKQVGDFYSFLSSQIGKKYDFSGIFGFAFSAKTQAKDKWFCSELIFAAAQFAGIDLLRRIEPHKVSPGLLQVSPKLEKIAELEV